MQPPSIWALIKLQLADRPDECSWSSVLWWLLQVWVPSLIDKRQSSDVTWNLSLLNDWRFRRVEVYILFMFSQMKVSTFPAIWEKPGDNMERKKKYSRDQNDCTKRGENPFQFWQLERKNFNCLKSHTHPARTRPQVQEEECTLFPNCHIASFFTQSNTACKDKHQILLPNAMLRYL